MRKVSSRPARFLRRLLIAVAFAGSIAAVGCTSTNNSTTTTTTEQISVAISPSAAQTLDQGKTLAVTATLTNDTTNQGVTWSLTGAGTLSGSTAAATTYTAPTSVTAASTATLTATSNADTTKSATLTINLVVPPSVTTSSLPPATVGTAYSATLAATGGITPYSWTVSAGTLPNGLSLDSSTGEISGMPTTNGTSNFTVQVTDAQNVSKTADLSIMVSFAPLAVVTTALPAGNVGVAYSASLEASGGKAPYTWTKLSGTLPTGLTLDPSGTISGTPTTEISPATFTVQAMDSLNTTAMGDVTITIEPVPSGCSSGSESKLDGRYAFQIQGFYVGGFPATPFGLIGSFVADGSGSITEGVEDVNSAAGVHTEVPLDTTNSSYSVGSDDRGCLTIATSAGTRVFRFSLSKFTSGVAGEGRLIEFDSDSTSMLGSGVIEQQDPSTFTAAHIAGTYAFGLSGFVSPTESAAAAGTVAISPPDATWTEDFNFGGYLDSAGTDTWPDTPLSFSGSVSDISSDGRGVLTTVINSSTQTHTVFYAVSDQRALLMGIDPQSPQIPLLAGMAMQQTGGPFSNASLNSNVVFYGTGITPGAAPPPPPSSAIAAGVISIPSAGNFSENFDYNDGTTTESNSYTGTYTVDSNGRATFSISGSSGIATIDYLVSPNKGFFVNRNNEVISGFFEPQTGGPFTNGSFSGTYSFGTLAPTKPLAQNESGILSADGMGTVTSGTSDSDSVLFGLSTDTHTNVPYSIDSTGRGTTTNGIIYVISPSKAVLFDTSPGNPSIRILTQQ